MPNKPDKFGLKYFLVVDLKTKYVCNGVPYLGKNENKPEGEGLAFYLVKKLLTPFEKRGHVVTGS